MKKFTRRESLKLGATALAGAAVGMNLGQPALGQEPTLDLKPEQGATLRVLRPAKFVAGDEQLWLENTEKYTKATGVQVKVESGERREGPGCRLWLV
jgi:multiple sugar transport system substrate-binding protein